jgi:hypothetical protein
VAHKKGYLTETRQLVLSPGQRMAVAIELTTLEDVRESSRRWAGWKPWAVVGAGALLATAGGVLDWRAGSEYERFDIDFAELGCAGRDGQPGVVTGCRAGEVPPALEDTLDRARFQERAALTLYAVAGAAVATGAVLLYLNRPRARTGEVSTMSVSGSIGPDSGLVTATFGF